MYVCCWVGIFLLLIGDVFGGETCVFGDKVVQCTHGCCGKTCCDDIIIATSVSGGAALLIVVAVTIWCLWLRGHCCGNKKGHTDKQHKPQHGRFTNGSLPAPNHGGFISNQAAPYPDPYGRLPLPLPPPPSRHGGQELPPPPSHFREDGPSSPNYNQGGPPPPNYNQGGPPTPNYNQGGPPPPNYNQGGPSTPNYNHGGPPQPNYNQGGPPPPNYNHGGPPQPNYNQGGPPPPNYNHGGPTLPNNHTDRPLPPNFHRDGPPPQNYNRDGPAPSNYNQGGPPSPNYDQGGPPSPNYDQGGQRPPNYLQGRPPPPHYGQDGLIPPYNQPGYRQLQPQHHQDGHWLSNYQHKGQSPARYNEDGPTSPTNPHYQSHADNIRFPTYVPPHEDIPRPRSVSPYPVYARPLKRHGNELEQYNPRVLSPWQFRRPQSYTEPPRDEYGQPYRPRPSNDPLREHRDCLYCNNHNQYRKVNAFPYNKRNDYCGHCCAYEPKLKRSASFTPASGAPRERYDDDRGRLRRSSMDNVHRLNYNTQQQSPTKYEYNRHPPFRNQNRREVPEYVSDYKPRDRFQPLNGLRKSASFDNVYDRNWHNAENDNRYSNDGYIYGWQGHVGERPTDPLSRHETIKKTINGGRRGSIEYDKKPQFYSKGTRIYSPTRIYQKPIGDTRADWKPRSDPGWNRRPPSRQWSEDGSGAYQPYIKSPRNQPESDTNTTRNADTTQLKYGEDREQQQDYDYAWNTDSPGNNYAGRTRAALTETLHVPKRTVTPYDLQRRY